MGRKRIPIGRYGEIFFDTRNGTVRARTRYRQQNGVLTTVAASGSSRTAARQALLADIEYRFGRGTGSAADGITPDTKVADLAQEWLREAELRNLSTSTLRIYRSSVRLYIGPYMGEWLIREATTGAVDRVIKNHIAAGLDSSALRKHLNQMFDVAVRHDALVANPVDSIARVRRRKPRPKALDNAAQIAEIRALIERWETAERPGPKVGTDLRDVNLLLISTGARIGEILALRWCDINLLADQPYLMITGTIKQEKGLGIYRQPRPKSDTSIRPLELPPSAVSMLMERQFNQGPNSIDAVFPSRVGTWQPYASMRRRWEAVVKDTPYEWVTFKTFRKSVATLVANELGLSVAKEQMGHSSEATTETFYVARGDNAPKVSGLLEKFIQESAPSN